MRAEHFEFLVMQEVHCHITGAFTTCVARQRCAEHVPERRSFLEQTFAQRSSREAATGERMSLALGSLPALSPRMRAQDCSPFDYESQGLNTLSCGRS